MGKSTGISRKLFTGAAIAITMLAAMSATSMSEESSESAAVCGSFSGGSFLSVTDLNGGINFLYHNGPAPFDATADIDEHRVYTIRDFLTLYQYIFEGHGPLSCPSTLPSLELLPVDASNYITLSTAQIEAGDSITEVTISLTNTYELAAVSLPIKLFVCGDPPEVDNISLSFPGNTLDSGGAYDIATGCVLIYWIGKNVPTPGGLAPGTYEVATFQIRRPASAACTPITYALEKTGPVDDFGFANIPLFVGNNMPSNTPVRPDLHISNKNGKSSSLECECLASCCVPPFRGNFDNSPDFAPQYGMNIIDVTTLVSYLFAEGTPPACPEEANVDGIGIANILDVNRLVSYLFAAGIPPAGCP